MTNQINHKIMKNNFKDVKPDYTDSDISIPVFRDRALI